MLRREPSDQVANRRESIGRLNPRSTSLSDPPPTKTVTVAVLPPRAIPGVGTPRTGVGMAHAFNWDEALNWKQDQPSPQEPAGQRKKGFFKRTLTTERKRANPNSELPPFVMKNVPFEMWRKHYAKDKDGNYRGTSTPAEDCLLLPRDVEKWKLKDDAGEGNGTWADRFTRGKEALPVYGEAIDGQEMVPGYEEDDEGAQENGRQDYDRPPPAEPMIEEELSEEQQQSDQRPQTRDPDSGLGYDAESEREELLRRNSGREGWKANVKRGLEMAAMGGGGTG